MSTLTTVPSMSTPPMTPEQQATFYTWFGATRRDELLGVLLALLLGSEETAHLYLRRPALGVLYLVFFWTGIPALLGFIEAFFMPGRVRMFNAEQAAMLTQAVLAGAMPPMATPTMAGCRQCGWVQPAEARYCARCGRAMA